MYRRTKKWPNSGKKKFFTIIFLDYDLRRNRKRLIKKISIGYEGRHIAQMKEDKKCFQKMKKYGDGTGSNFTLKFFDNFQIVKKRLRNNYENS